MSLAPRACLSIPVGSLDQVMAERVVLAGAAAQTAPYGTHASELQALAPCMILEPGRFADTHKPTEAVSLSALAAAVPVFMWMAQRLAP